MKKILTYLLAVLLTGTGCSLLNSDAKTQAAQFDNFLRVAATVGSQLYVKEHPDKADSMRLALSALNALLLSDQVEPDALNSALQLLDTEQIKGGSSAVIIGNGTTLVEEADGTRTPITTTKQAKEATVILRDGLASALTP